MILKCPNCGDRHTERPPGKPRDNRCIPCVSKWQRAYYQANRERYKAHRERYKAERAAQVARAPEPERFSE